MLGVGVPKSYNTDAVRQGGWRPPMHHDLAWWGTFLAVVALVLMLPVSIAANILTPILKNWWAERSDASTQKRIESIEKQLADYEQYAELSEGVDYVLMATEALAMLLGLCNTMLAVILLLLVTFDLPTVSVPDKRPFALLALVAGLGTFLIGLVVFGRFSRFRQKRSPFNRNMLRNYIAKLREKLAK
jgi:phosphate/sulfate permease